MKSIFTGLIFALMTSTIAHADLPAVNDDMLTIKTYGEDELLVFDPEQYPEVYCLALNVYYESRGSNLADQYAVADVVLNRTNDSRWPNTVCGVVKQGRKHASGHMKRNQCQFSWYCDGKADKPQDEDSWIRSQTVAFKIAYYGQMRGISEGANHYHASYVSPAWAKKLQLVGRIGAHVFYRWN